MSKSIVGAARFAACIALFGNAADAAVLTYTNSYVGPTDVTNQPISVSQFNSALGTLLSVTIRLDANMATQMSTTSDGNFFAGWDKETYSVSLDGSSVFGSAVISASSPATRIVGTGDPSAPLAFGTSVEVNCVAGTPLAGGTCSGGSGAYTWTRTGPTLNTSGVFTDVTPGSQYVGVGTLLFLLTTLNYDELYAAGLQSSGLPSPAPVGVLTNVSGSVSVDYEYSPVPLPAAAWLLLSGLAGIGVFGRRRIRS